METFASVQLWSLAEVIQVYAEKYIHMGKVFQYWIALENPSSGPLPDEEWDSYSISLEGLRSHCELLQLETSQKLFANTIAALKRDVSQAEACATMGELSRCVEAEIESKLFYFIPASRAQYVALFRFGEQWKLGTELQRFFPIMESGFPSIFRDLCEAGNCFGTGAFTACVYHLMRVCEYGLVSLAKSAGADPGHASWETVIKRIEAKLRENSNTKPTGWKDEEEFYSSAAAHMRNVKNSWRNNTAHIPRWYDETGARIIFNAVEALMQHLNTRLKEEDIPSASILSDPEASNELSSSS